MRSIFAGFTTRGRAFLASGLATAVLGLILGQRDLLSVGAVLIVLPLLAAAAANRSRSRIRCTREIVPSRVPTSQSAVVTVRLDNVSKVPTGLLLAEDSVPFALAARPRFVLDRIEPVGSRKFSYQLRSDHRGKFLIGPLHIRVADVFGLVRLGTAGASPGTLLVTPLITNLPRTALAGSWLGAGGTRASLTASAGDDDVVPRPYREGDELRRVHWRSTARHGELMVRREEQHWRNRTVLFLDTRANAHAGRGLSSSFEFAVSATASIGVHLAREGIDGQFLTDSGPVQAPGSFEDTLLDSLATIRTSRNEGLAVGLSQIPRGDSGLLIAIVGYLSAAHAQQLAAARRDAPGMALLLSVGTWVPGRESQQSTAGTDVAAGILAAAGWRVTTVTATTPLTTAWEKLTSQVGPVTRGIRPPVTVGPAT